MTVAAMNGKSGEQKLNKTESCNNTDDGSPELCDLCRTVVYCFSADPDTPDFHWGIRLGTISNIKERGDCAFRQWLAQFLERDDHQRKPSQSVIIPEDPLIELSLKRDVNLRKTPCLIEATFSHFIESYYYPIVDLRGSVFKDSTTSGTIESQDCNSYDPSPVRFGPVKSVKPLESTATLVKHWLQRCTLSHSQCRRSFVGRSRRAIRVIDTRTA